MYQFKIAQVMALLELVCLEIHKTLFAEGPSCDLIIEYRNINTSTFLQCSGGNFIFQYDNEVGIFNSTATLFISSCLFSLGLNSMYGNFTYPSPLPGTALVLYVKDSGNFLTIKLNRTEIKHTMVQ